jgi:hypothetical protein
MTFHLAGQSKVLVGLRLPGFLLFFLFFYLFFDRLLCFVVEELVKGWIFIIVLINAHPLHLPCLARPLVVVKAGHQ